MCSLARGIAIALTSLLAFAGSEAQCQTSGTASGAKVPLTAADLVRQTVIGDPNSLTWNDSASVVSATSPDGKSVAVVLRRGNTELLTNDAELLVYETATLLSDPRARTVARAASATNYQPIALVQWLRDSETLVFAATHGKDLPQIYSFSLRFGELRQITHAGAPIQSYDITPSGDWLVTALEPQARSPESDPVCLQRGCLVSAETLYAAEQGAPETSASLVIHDLRSGEARTVPAPEATDTDLMECRDQLYGGLSPDGRFALRLCKFRVGRWPEWWADYTAFPRMREVLARGDNGYVRQWILVDLQRGTNSRLATGPYYMSHLHGGDPIWLDDGRVIIAGALEPLEGVDPHERGRRAAHYAVVEIDLHTLETKRIASLDPKAASVSATAWNEKARTLVIESIDAEKNSLPGLAYRRDNSGWHTVRGATAVASRHESAGPRLIIEQSLNDRPRLVAVDPRGKRKRKVLDPNPWLDDRQRGRVEAIEWVSKDGRKWTGGLYYPPHHLAGTRYPLVLLTHGFEPDRFSLCGAARNFAAQALAAHGMLVLQVRENVRGTAALQEWPTSQAGYESAIDHLDRLGLIDPLKVGIQGWSRTGPYIGYTLTHSSYPFAAAAFTATADFGWWWYMSVGARHGESAYGGPPFGKNFDVWKEYSPSFNLDRVRAPMLMWATGASGLWDWYAGLRRLGKPVEYWSAPDATHDVFKVGERLRVNELAVDWFRFWLKNEEDADEGKAEQYARWRKLRVLRARSEQLRGQETDLKTIDRTPNTLLGDGIVWDNLVLLHLSRERWTGPDAR